MSDTSRVDELFGAHGAGARLRTPLARALIAGGLVLTLGGLACSSVPGGLVVLLGWSIADDDLDRVRSGALPSDGLSEATATRLFALVAVVFVVLAFIAQAAMLQIGVYDELWGRAIELAFPPPPDPSL